MDRRKKIVVFVVLLGLCVSVTAYVSIGLVRLWGQTEQQRIAVKQRKAVWIRLKNTLEQTIAGFRGEAGIVVKDLTFDWQYSFNKDKLFPSASLVKIPVMAACFTAAKEGRISLSDTLTLRESQRTGGSGVLKNAPAGTTLSIAKIMETMITESDNTATNMLIDALGFDYLNRTFKKMGLAHTNLSRKMMDFSYRKKGVENYTSASDITFLLDTMYRRTFLSPAVSEQCLAMLLRQKVNDRIPKKLPQDLPVAHKTGLERHVCHDAGIVFTQQGDFLICVLTRSTVQTKLAKNFIANLALAIYSQYAHGAAGSYRFLNDKEADF